MVTSITNLYSIRPQLRVATTPFHGKRKWEKDAESGTTEGPKIMGGLGATVVDCLFSIPSNFEGAMAPPPPAPIQKDCSMLILCKYCLVTKAKIYYILYCRIV